MFPDSRRSSASIRFSECQPSTSHLERNMFFIVLIIPLYMWGGTRLANEKKTLKHVHFLVPGSPTTRAKIATYFLKRIEQERFYHVSPFDRVAFQLSGKFQLVIILCSAT